MGRYYALLNLLLAAPLAAQTPDPTFGTAGFATIDFAGQGDDAQEVIVQPDGHVLVGGYAYGVVGPADFCPTIARLMPDGSPDASFSGDGLASVPIASAAGQAMALLPDGRILLGGNWYDFGLSMPGLMVARFLANGTIDATFGTSGVAQPTTFPTGATFWDMDVQADGKIVVTGQTIGGSSNDVIVVRLLTNGTLDTSFGTSGFTVLVLGSGTDQSLAVEVQPDGKILVAGYTNQPGYEEAFVARLLTNGQPDASFGTNGVRILNADVDDDERASDIELYPDGRIAVCGEADQDAFAAVLLPDGTNDPSFGTGGVAINPVIDAQVADRVAIDNEGGLVLACTVDGDFYDIQVIRFLADGTLDPDYEITIPILNDDAASAIAIQPDGKVLVAGESDDGGLSADMQVIRLSAPGQTAVEERPIASPLLVHPNPASQVLNLCVDAMIPDAMITVRDAAGRIVLRTRWNDLRAGQLDVSDLSIGTYTIELAGSGAVFIARFTRS